MTSIDDRNSAQLSDMGYQTTCVAESFDDGGRITREYSAQSMRPLRMPNGAATDFTPPANLAVVTYAYTSELWPERYSKIAGKFADALVRLLATPDGPLIRRTARSVEFIYRLEGVVCPRLDDVTVSYGPELYPHGLMARDARATLVLCVGCPDVPVSDASEWLASRSPLTVARMSLPEFDANAASIAIAGLVDRFAAAGDMEVSGRYLEPASTAPSGPAHRERLTSPTDLDPADPIRRIPGAIAKLFRRRRELGLEGLNDDELHAKLDEQRAARSPGQYMSEFD